MPQSLLVLLGLVLASVLVISQVRSGHRTETSLEHVTIQTAATIAAAERLTFLESLPFDEGAKAGVATSVSALTPVVDGLFVRVGSPDVPNDDLDDFHGRVIVGAAALAEGAALHPLTTAITVRYVRETNLSETSAVPTRFKEATVTVTTPGAPPVRLTQLYSCAGHCAW